MIRIIQVGLGAWGANWAVEVLPRVRNVEVTAYVDANPATHAAIRSALGVPPTRCFTSLAAALCATDADAVLGTLALPAHVPIGQQALEAGKHYIVEKPFAPALAEAAALVDLARQRDRLLMVSQNYRFYPAAIAAAELVRSGRLGRPLSVAIDFRRCAPLQGHGYPAIPDPLLGDMAIHHFDLLRFVLGLEPLSVACRTWNPPGSPFTHDPAAFATVAFEAGVMVSYSGSWVSRGAITPWAGEWQMDFEGGELQWTCRSGGNTGTAGDRLAIRPLGGRLEAVALPPLEMFDRAGTISAFARCIETGEMPAGFSSGADNLASLALTHAAMTSAAHRGMPVAVADLLPASDRAHTAKRVPPRQKGPATR
jgi:predicted dehydrogenase